MRRELSDGIVEYLESPDLLKQHKQAAYRLFQSRQFDQAAVADRFTKLLGVPTAGDGARAEPFLEKQPHAQ
jgi:hypothetical protein